MKKCKEEKRSKHRTENRINPVKCKVVCRGTASKRAGENSYGSLSYFEHFCCQRRSLRDTVLRIYSIDSLKVHNLEQSENRLIINIVLLGYLKIFLFIL